MYVVTLRPVVPITIQPRVPSSDRSIRKPVSLGTSVHINLIAVGEDEHEDLHRVTSYPKRCLSASRHQEVLSRFAAEIPTTATGPSSSAAAHQSAFAPQ